MFPTKERRWRADRGIGVSKQMWCEAFYHRRAVLSGAVFVHYWLSYRGSELFAQVSEVSAEDATSS
jgi:hypothetical protein